MHQLRTLALMLSVLVVSTANATSADGLAIDSQIEFEAGGTFDPAKVPLRDNVLERSRQALARYAAAPAPKALAVSEDRSNWGNFYLPAEATRWPRDTQDARRIALQNCQFASGLRCRLIAVDDHFSARNERLYDALPEGDVSERMLPFWLRSSASDLGRRIVRDYLSTKGNKALIVAPFGDARLYFNTAATVEEARDIALSRCASVFSQPGVRCVVLAENDQFVIRDIDQSRSTVSGARIETVRNLSIVAVGAENCEPSRRWRQTQLPRFLGSELGRSVDFRQITAKDFNDVRNTAIWPDDLKWLREQGHIVNRTPHFLVVADGKVVRSINDSSNWDRQVIPYVQDLAKRKAR